MAKDNLLRCVKDNPLRASQESKRNQKPSLCHVAQSLSRKSWAGHSKITEHKPSPYMLSDLWGE